MKRLLTLFVVLGLVACVAGVASAQNLLVDGGMNSVGANGQLGNTPNPPWQLAASQGGVAGFNDGAASEGFADVDGGGFGLFFKAFVGNPPWNPEAGAVDVDFFQDVAAPDAAGMTYKLHGWFGAEANYSGLNTPGAQSLFAIDFLDAGNAVIGGTELDLEPGLAANIGNGNPVNYGEFWITATAPLGTTTVRARATMLDGAFFHDPGQAFVTDFWTLVKVPEPASLSLIGLAALGLVGIRRRSK